MNTEAKNEFELLRQSFTGIWKSGGAETPCGEGSTLVATTRLRKMLPIIIECLQIRTVNDAGCGDLNWLQTTELNNVDYLGIDVIEYPSWRAFTERAARFQVADFTRQRFRSCDLTICRDAMIHLPNASVTRAIGLFRRQSRYLLATSFAGADNSNRIIAPGQFAALDLTVAPFSLGPPKIRIEEKIRGKFVGLWQLNDERPVS